MFKDLRTLYMHYIRLEEDSRLIRWEKFEEIMLSLGENQELALKVIRFIIKESSQDEKK